MTVVTPGTPVPLASVQTLVDSADLVARSAPGVANVDNVYIGSATMNKTTGAGVYKVLGPDNEIPLKSPRGLMDLALWFVDADHAGDGVSGGYVSP